MTARKVLLGLCTGLAASYALVRAAGAVREWREPSPLRAKDALEYTRVRRTLEVVDTVRGTLGFVGFAYGPLAHILDRATHRAPAWLRPALFFAPLSLIGAIADLGSSFLGDYTLERRFGLSDQTRRAWLEEYAKSTLIGSALTAFLATLLGTAVRRAVGRGSQASAPFRSSSRAISSCRSTCCRSSTNSSPWKARSRCAFAGSPADSASVMRRSFEWT
jgi:hypothetical protein